MNDTSQVQRFEVQPTQFSGAVIHNEFSILYICSNYFLIFFARMSCSEQSAFHGQVSDRVWSFSELLFQSVAAKKNVYYFEGSFKPRAYKIFTLLHRSNLIISAIIRPYICQTRSFSYLLWWNSMGKKKKEKTFRYFHTISLSDYPARSSVCNASRKSWLGW